MKIYSIYDKVSKRFNAPFLAENDDVANRSFQNGVKSNPFASDFDLYCVGIFMPEADTASLVLDGCTVPNLVSHYIGEIIDNG